MKRLSVLIILIISLLVQSCDALISLDYRLMKLACNKKGSFVTKDYSIRIAPFCSLDYPEGSRDSCRLFITRVDNPALIDTFVFIPKTYDKDLMISLFNDNKWALDTKGDYRCTSHFLETVEASAFKAYETPKDVIRMLVLSSKTELFYYSIESQPPYFPNYRYDSSKRKHGRVPYKRKHLASAQVGSRNIDWYHSHYYNYAIISNDGKVTDSLRWFKGTVGWNSFSLMVVGDTLVFEDHNASRPTCTSPLIIRKASDLREQYSLKAQLGWKEYMDKPVADDNSVILVDFVDVGSLSFKGVIKVSTLNLPSSPTSGTNIKEEFYKNHSYLLE